MDERVQKAFRMMFSPNQGERENAAKSVVALCESAGLSPTDITLIHSRELHGSLYEQRRKLQADVEDLGEALAFIKSRATDDLKVADVVRWLEQRRTKVDRWPQLRELASRRLFRGSWPEERSVFKMIASAVGVTPEEVRSWREGVQEIPEAILQTLRSAVPGQKRKPAAKKVVAKAKVLFGNLQLPEKEHQVLQTLLPAGRGGLHLSKIAERADMKSKTVTSRLSYLKGFGLAEQAGKPGFWRATGHASAIAGDDGSAEGLQVA